MANYFNSLPLRQQLAQLGKCEFMDPAEFSDEANYLKGKKLVVVGCGSQGAIRREAPADRGPRTSRYDNSPGDLGLAGLVGPSWR